MNRNSTGTCKFSSSFSYRRKERLNTETFQKDNCYTSRQLITCSEWTEHLVEVQDRIAQLTAALQAQAESYVELEQQYKILERKYNSQFEQVTAAENDNIP